MTAGDFVDRVLNAALIKAAQGANKLMELTLPMRHGTPIDMSDLLVEFEQNNEVHEPPQTCDISGHPLAVEDVAPPAGAGVSPDSAADTGGHPDRATSELLEDAAYRIVWMASRIWDTGFVNELRDRASAFAAFGD